MSDDSDARAASPSATPGCRGRSRGVVVTVLTVVASLLLPFAAVTVWVRNLVLDTDRYVETVRPLADDTAVREAVATKVSAALVATLDVERRAKTALPPRAQFLAAPIATGARQLVHDATIRVLDTDRFRSIWERANRRAHGQVDAALTGRDSGRLVRDDGKVVLRLGPLAAEVARRLDEVGFGLPSNVDVSRVDVRFVLIDSADLASIQSFTRLLDALAWVLPIVALALAAGAIVIAVDRRVALQRVGIGTTVAMIVAVVAYGFGRTLYLDALPGAGPHDAGAVVFDTVTRYLQQGLRGLLVLGVLLWLVVWLAGPSGTALAVRRQWRRLVGRASSAGDGSPGPVSRWVGGHEALLRGLLLAGLGLLLVTGERPTGTLVVVLATAGLVGLGVIQLVGAGARRVDPSPDS